jgi:hypothetical protein
MPPRPRENRAFANTPRYAVQHGGTSGKYAQNRRLHIACRAVLMHGQRLRRVSLHVDVLRPRPSLGRRRRQWSDSNIRIPSRMAIMRMLEAEGPLANIRSSGALDLTFASRVCR